MTTRPVEMTTDATIGKAIRELWEQGLSVLVLPDGERIVLAVMDTRPGEDEYVQLYELVIDAGEPNKRD